MRRGEPPVAGKAGIGRSGHRSGRSRWFAWIAVAAVLFQTLIPHAAMAARGAPAPWSVAPAVAAGLCLADAVRHGDGADHPAPAATWQEVPCAFCLALSVHGLAPVGRTDDRYNNHADGPAPPNRVGIVPPVLFGDSLSARAPPPPDATPSIAAPNV